VLHCPSSNLKLGSGVAPITRYLERGVPVSIGADGAPCNNNLDALREARLAALLQKPLFGPTALPAAQALRLITIHGAEALGMADQIGSLEVGKRADLVEIDLGGVHVAPGGDACSRVIYAADRSDIARVYVDGEVVIEDGRPTFLDEAELLEEVERNAGALFARAGLAR
jgi:5-methylthioadenosine/S-adenosylhomocysteine deaminase